jgi:hypothetical protein
MQRPRLFARTDDLPQKAESFKVVALEVQVTLTPPCICQ